MPWLKLDDAMGDHRKIRRLMKGSRAGMALHTLGLLHCSKYLTDGRVDEDIVEDICDDARMPARERAAALSQLEKLNLWERVEGGWQIHDYLDYNPSRAEVLADRNAQRRRQEISRDQDLVEGVRSRDRNRCRYCGQLADWKDRRSSKGATYDFVDPEGPTTLDNVVTACRGCSKRKHDRTLAEAGMVLLAPSSTGDAPPLWPVVEPESPPAPPADSGSSLVTNQDGSESSQRPVPDPTRPDPAGISSPAVLQSWVDACGRPTQDFPTYIVGILQRGINGIEPDNDEHMKAPTRAAIVAALEETGATQDIAMAVAIESRSTAQSQNRAPNIAALYRQQLKRAVKEAA